jgi:predicted enzyme related to lactoylglutathione lyase
MKLGEICILTNDVTRLARFYRDLLGISENSADTVHQTIIGEETMLTLYNDGTKRKGTEQNMCIAFSCDDVDREYERLSAAGIEIIESPVTRPWGTRNMSLYDPDRNVVYLRTLP